MRQLLVLALLGCALAASAAEPAQLVDLDLTAADGRPPAGAKTLVCSGTGVAWTADGLFLPAAAISRVPREYPMHEQRLPMPRPPYRAELTLPPGTGAPLTVTLVVALATTDGDQDNLFSIGRRSRWLAGQVDARGAVVAGLDNRWVVLPAAGLPTVSDRRWHVISIGVDAAHAVRIGVDAAVRDLTPPRDPSRFPPQALPDDPPVLSFADPGSARHLHGLVRRIVVHRGLLAADAIAALHHLLASGLAAPVAPLFAGAGRPPPPVETDAPGPVNANDF